MVKPEETKSENEETITADELVQTAIKNAGIEKKPNKGKIAEVMKAMLEKGISPQKAMGVDDDFMEEVYGHGYRLYQGGKYQDALEAFQILQTLNPTDSRFCRGIALCYERLDNIDLAVKWYVSTAILEDSPVPYFQAVECYIHDNAPFAANVILGQIIRTCENRPEFSEHKERAELLRQSLKDRFEKIEEEPNKRKKKE